MSEPIQFYNRYTDAVETEVVYGESYLRWTYENPFGRLALNLLLKRSLFSSWYGWRMDRPGSREKVAPFIERYGIDMSECRADADSFGSFNDFFYRELTGSARPIAAGDDTISLPADGRHMVIPTLSQVDQVYVKGQGFDLEAFLGRQDLAERFSDGSMAISRLCPVDYHRYHSPVAGRVADQYEVGGSLFSVSPIALCRKIGYLWENKRLVTTIDTDAYGLVAFVAIGATCVGRIHMTRSVGDEVGRGEELGYFAFGGSCVATIFERGRVALESDLLDYSAQTREVYAKMGDRLGVGRPATAL